VRVDFIHLPPQRSDYVSQLQISVEKREEKLFKRNCWQSSNQGEGVVHKRREQGYRME